MAVVGPRLRMRVWGCAERKPANPRMLCTRDIWHSAATGEQSARQECGAGWRGPRDSRVSTERATIQGLSAQHDLACAIPFSVRRTIIHAVRRSRQGNRWFRHQRLSKRELFGAVIRPGIEARDKPQHCGMRSGVGPHEDEARGTQSEGMKLRQGM